MRWRKREATVGWPPRFFARLRIASRAPSARDEIMRRLADAPLRRRKAERGAHRPVEKGVGLDRGRPDRFVEARQKHAIEAQETRFEQAEDLQAWVSAACRRSARRRQRIVEQGGVFVERSGEALDRRLAPFVHELRQLLESRPVLRRAVRSATVAAIAARC